MIENRGWNAPLAQQAEFLQEIIQRNEVVYEVIRAASRFGLPNWYVGAGCITQSVWNYLGGRPLTENIKDIDLVYFDGDDLSEDTELEIAGRVRDQLRHVPFELDVANEARVHQWYAGCFGYDINPYTSCEAAINTWPTTATCVGVRLDEGGWRVYAPYGLNDLFGGVLRANKTQITEGIYQAKVERWTKHWPHLLVVPWAE